MTETEIEEQIQLKQLNAPRLTPADIDAKIACVSYTLLPSGKTMVCELILENSFSVQGISSVVSKVNFNTELGKTISYKKARDKIWELEGYLLQDKLFKE